MCAMLAVTGCGNSPATDNAARPDGNAPEGKRYILLMNGNSPFWDAVGAGIRAAAEEWNVNAVLATNDGTPAGQINQLKQFATQLDIAAVGISAVDADNPALAEEMARLREKGVAVVAIDSDVDREIFRDSRYAFVGTNNLEAGMELGKAIRHLRSDGGNYVTFVGVSGAQNAIERIAGVKEGVGEAFTNVDNMQDNNDRSKARQNVRDAMANHPNLDTLVGIWSYNAPAIVDVLDEKQNRDQFTVAVFDAEPAAIEAMEAGKIDVMLVQNPFQMGYQGIRLMHALVEEEEATLQEMYPNYGQPEGDIYDTGLKIVVPDGNEKLSANQFGEKTEFLTLSEFRAWLEEYGLTGS